MRKQSVTVWVEEADVATCGAERHTSRCVCEACGLGILCVCWLWKRQLIGQLSGLRGHVAMDAIFLNWLRVADVWQLSCERRPCDSVWLWKVETVCCCGLSEKWSQMSNVRRSESAVVKWINPSLANG